MNEVLEIGYCLANSDDEGIMKDLALQEKKFNVIWGLEYFIMNEKSFIENNCEAIIEMMVKSRKILSGL